MSEKEDYCKNKSAPEGSSLYYATLYESEKNKHLIFPLFAIHYELFDCLTASPDPGVTRMKLHWWQEELERLSGHAPRHPVTNALLPGINANPFMMEYLHQHYLCITSLVDTRHQHLNSDWIVHWYTVLGQLWSCLEKLTGKCDNDAQIIRNGGIIFMLEILQNFYLLSGKLPGFLPMDLLGKHSLRRESLNQQDQQVVVCRMFDELLNEILLELDMVHSEMKKMRVKPGLYHVIMNRIAYSLCKEILDDGSQIMQHKIAITPLRKLWIGWRSKIFY